MKRRHFNKKRKNFPLRKIKINILIKKRKIFQSENGKYFKYKQENIPITKRKNIQVMEIEN